MLKKSWWKSSDTYKYRQVHRIKNRSSWFLRFFSVLKQKLNFFESFNQIFPFSVLLYDSLYFQLASFDRFYQMSLLMRFSAFDVF